MDKSYFSYMIEFYGFLEKAHITVSRLNPIAPLNFYDILQVGNAIGEFISSYQSLEKDLGKEKSDVSTILEKKTAYGMYFKDFSNYCVKLQETFPNSDPIEVLQKKTVSKTVAGSFYRKTTDWFLRYRSLGLISEHYVFDVISPVIAISSLVEALGEVSGKILTEEGVLGRND